MNKNKPDDELRILVQNKHFLTENSPILEQHQFLLVGMFFVNCNFEKVHLPGGTIGGCKFQNCIFNDFMNAKGTLINCYFEDCKITNSDMTRGDFYDTNFKNCEFVDVNLAASDIYSCTFKETSFLKSNLQLIAIDNVKVWKSNEWVQIEDCSNFEKHLEVTRPDMVTKIYVDFDFNVQGPPPLKYLYVKIPVGSEVLRRQNQTISLKDMAYNMGKKFVFQKHRFVGIENGPASSEEVAHLVDLAFIPPNEKSTVRDNILKGAQMRIMTRG